MKIFAAALLMALATCVPAQAQIYSWRDGNGNLVLSNIKPASAVGVQSYAVPKTQSVRATRYAAPRSAQLYDELIAENARRHGVRPDLVRAVMQVESAFNPMARSPKGALGLMQLMPATMKQFGVSNPFSPSENVGAGVAYLRELLDRYQNDETLALAAYNAGPTAVDKHGQTVPPYRETRNYVAQINRMVGPVVEPRDHRIYKVTETIDGHTIVSYTDKRPVIGSRYEVVAR